MDSLSAAKTSVGRLSLRAVLRARLLLGFYCATSSTTAQRCLARLYCLCLTYILTIMLLKTAMDFHMGIFFFLATITEYNLNVLISLITGENQFFRFCKLIERTDLEMGYAHLPLMTPATQYIFVSICIYRVLYSVFFLVVILNFHFDWIYLSVSVINAALYFNNIINVLSLDLLRHRLFLLRHDLNFNFGRYYGTRTTINRQIKSIMDSLRLYKALIDELNGSFSWKKLQLTANLVTAVIIFLRLGYNTVYFLSFEEVTLSGVLFAMELLMSTGVVCLPSVFTELVIREVDLLKAFIGNQLLACEDPELASALELAAEFLQQRPFKVTVWRVLELDGRMALAFVGFCTTYLIVVVQITGLI